MGKKMKDKPRIEYKIFHIDFQDKKLLSIDSWFDDAPALPPEAIAFLEAYDAGETVYTKFITSDPKNKIPPSLQSQKHAVVKWNKNFSIPDFGTDVSGVFGSLSFAGRNHLIFITWTSIFQISNGDQIELGAWPEKVK